MNPPRRSPNLKHQAALEPHSVFANECSPGFIRSAEGRGPRADGLRYERRVLEKISAEVGGAGGLVPSQWFSFLDGAGGQRRYCQIDGFSFDLCKGTITIYEIKLRHTHDSWWQLTQLYEPVLRAFFPSNVWTYRLIEICRWFDPATYYPVKPVMLANLAQSFTGIGVHICKL